MRDGAEKLGWSRISRGRMFTQLQVQKLKRMLKTANNGYSRVII
jgi:hypothetical protein